MYSNIKNCDILLFNYIAKGHSMNETEYQYRSSEENAAVIASEVSVKGFSEGWYGTDDEVKDIATILRAQNIYYVSDTKGRWERCQ